MLRGDRSIIMNNHVYNGKADGEGPRRRPNLIQRFSVAIQHKGRAQGFEAGEKWVIGGSGTGSCIRRLERLCLESCTDRPDGTLSFDWVAVEPTDNYGPQIPELLTSDLIAVALGDLDPRGKRDAGGYLVEAEDFWRDFWDGFQSRAGLSFHLWWAPQHEPNFLQGFVEGVIGTYWLLQHSLNEE
jgi:hypothetical protein